MNPFEEGAEAYWEWRNTGFQDSLFYDQINPYPKNSEKSKQFEIGWDDQDYSDEIDII